jgi:TPR repeat protein
MYFLGQGVKQDDKVALIWFKKAAKENYDAADRMKLDTHFIKVVVQK